jgi:uncharacterized protein YutE (UPF0331/DUF86 family)
MENIKDKEKEYNFILDEMNYEIQRSYRSRNKIRLLLKTYVYMGLLLFVIGSLYFAISFFEFNITSSQRMALIFSGVGLLLSLGAKFYVELIKEKEKEQIVRRSEIEKISNFILNWTTLERTLYKLVESKELSDNKFAIGKNLDLLLRKGIISNRDFITLEKALDLRNRIVHGRASTTQEDLNKYSEQLEIITDKIIDKI